MEEGKGGRRAAGRARARPRPGAPSCGQGVRVQLAAAGGCRREVASVSPAQAVLAVSVCRGPARRGRGVRRWAGGVLVEARGISGLCSVWTPLDRGGWWVFASAVCRDGVRGSRRSGC